MTFAPVDSAPGRKSRAPLVVGIIIGTLVVLGIGAAVLQYYTNWLWFASVQATSVFTRVLVMRIILFVAFGLIMAIGLWLSLWLPYRLRPPMRPTPDQIALERYRQAFDPARRFVFIAVPTLFGLLAGASASAEWRNWMLYLHGVPFAATDPQFHKNVGFYVYDYPVYRTILGFALTLLLLSTLSTIVVSYLYGGIRLQAPPGHRMYRASQVIVSVQLGLFFLVKAGQYWLDRFALELKQGNLITGVTYTDVHAVLPAKNLLFGASIIVALLFFANIFVQRWMIPIIGVISLFGLSILVGGVYPALVQRFSVNPSAIQKESPYITNNIASTRAAYALDAIKVNNNYSGIAVPTATYLKQDTGTLRNIRIMDPAVLPPTFTQLQAPWRYYAFPGALDIDRYTIQGQLREAVVAARELNVSGLGSSQQTWVNNHIVYTHGFGLVAAYSNTAQTNGNPRFFEKDIPPNGELGLNLSNPNAQPRVYFGEQSPDYSIVGAPAGSKPVEFDYPDNAKTSKQANNTYTGSGGVPIGSTLNRVAYALRFSDLNILLSNSVNAKSRLLYVRQPAQRVQEVAPWLTLDSDPYPTVVNNRIVWILDGYTTTANYPGSTPSAWHNATQDSLTNNAAGTVAQQQINYVRNSVKATVDAYNGTVTLYAWDNTKTDPLLKTWEAAFPGLIKPYSSMPDSIRQHVRYPEDMFKVQRTIYTKYHVTSPATFYNAGDNWAIPDDPSQSNQVAQPPYYLQLQMPDQTTPEFSLTSTFVRPGTTPSMAAFMSVSSQDGPDYGQIRVLQVQSVNSVKGPGQVQNTIESDPAISAQLRLWRGGGSDVVFGNMLSLPVAGGFLYVEPLFIKATSGSSYPLLGKVVATFGSTPVMKNDLPTALATLFGASSSGGGGGNNGGGGSSLTPQEQVTAALAAMQAALQEADVALAKGDWTAYGAAQKKLQRALDAAASAQARINSPSNKPGGSVATPSAHPSATPTKPAASPSPSG